MSAQNPHPASFLAVVASAGRCAPSSAATLLTVLCASCAALLLALFSPSVATAACPNEAVRAEQGPAALALPDCRAYELVSPGSTPSLTAESILGFGGGKASPEGDALSYFTNYPAKGSKTSSMYWLSRRSANGWTIEGVDPQSTPNPTKFLQCLPGVAFSEDLSSHLLSAGGELHSVEPNGTGECGLPAEELVPGEPRGYSNLYLRHGEAPYALANPVPLGEAPGNATYQAGSADLSRVVFSEDAQLTPEAPSGFNLFEWADGTVRLIGILPNGESVSARLAAATEDWGVGVGVNAGLAPVSHAVSADGERVFFQANGNLYLRENAGQAPAANANCLTTSESSLACTLQLDAKKNGLDESGGGVFQFASRDGDRVFFTSDHRLLSPSSAASGKPALYEYRVGTNKLIDLTLNSAGPANVRGFSGGSDDGSHVYFVARGVLTGADQNNQGEVAQLNQPNLYLVRNGELTYVATFSPWEEAPNLGGKDRENWWEVNDGGLQTAWSPSGQYLLFSSAKSLTGFDNTPAEPGLCKQLFEPPCLEIFLYDAEADDLSCVSCDPGNAKPVAHTEINQRQEFVRIVIGPRYAPRQVLDSGQVFFDTEIPLSSRDVNGFQDVYEYRSGTLSLISSGTAEGGSAFVDASADGRDVFFATPEALVRSDGDRLPSIYDARIGGGFAEPPLPPEPCAGEDSCRPSGSATPPTVALPFTATFAGQGNVRPRRCKRGKVLRRGRCVKKKKRKVRHHRKHRRGQRGSGGKR